MRFAYADPPYPGQAHLYRTHRDYAGEVDHRKLLDRLEREFNDGWALSTSSSALGYVLSLCPTVKLASELRVCVWRRQPLPRPPQRIMWSWEPLIVRTPNWRQRGDHDFVSDCQFASQPAGFHGNTITGQKPQAFCYWMFNLLGAGPDDELIDLFPGSGAVGHAWNAWRNQGSLLDAAGERSESPVPDPPHVSAPRSSAAPVDVAKAAAASSSADAARSTIAFPQRSEDRPRSATSG